MFISGGSKLRICGGKQIKFPFKLLVIRVPPAGTPSLCAGRANYLRNYQRNRRGPADLILSLSTRYESPALCEPTPGGGSREIELIPEGFEISRKGRREASSRVVGAREMFKTWHVGDSKDSHSVWISIFEFYIEILEILVTLEQVKREHAFI